VLLLVVVLMLLQQPYRGPSPAAVCWAAVRSTAPVPHPTGCPLFCLVCLVYLYSCRLAVQLANSHDLRRPVSRVAYFVPSGSYGKNWVRFGYDPRVHPSSAMYHCVEVRLTHAEAADHRPISDTVFAARSAWAGFWVGGLLGAPCARV
jgi:hypothetical protein